jgi:hypothetical protein
MIGKSKTSSPDIECFQFSHQVNSRFFTASSASTLLQSPYHGDIPR